MGNNWLYPWRTQGKTILLLTAPHFIGGEAIGSQQEKPSPAAEQLRQLLKSSEHKHNPEARKEPGGEQARWRKAMMPASTGLPASRRQPMIRAYQTNTDLRDQPAHC
jgi:hypothetical protein